MNRRSFIQKSGLLATTLFVSLKSYSALSLLAVDRKISGKVTSKGKGIANVLVSDGFSVIPTDKNGNYSIELNELARFIWISTPSGYEFTTNSNLAKYYEKLDARNALNFELNPMRMSDTRHNFIIWADPQVKNKKDVAQMMATAVPDTKKIIKSMGKIPVHGITVGDIVWDNHELFADYDLAVKEMGIPFFQCLGNHDMDYRMGGDDTSDRTFQEHYGPTYYSFNRGKAHYVVMDDVRYLGVERNYDGFISQAQLDWLAKDLSFVSKDALIIINLHIPVHNSVKNNADLYALLKDFTKVHIMSGHTHYTRNVITNGIFEHNHGAVCGAWWTGPVCEDGTPRGYGVYAVDGTDLKWYYQPTGLDRKEQVHIYIDELTNQKRLIANVWNWDPMWKVEYFLDGKAMGEMENQKGYDPQTVSLYKGPTLPAGRTFPEPHSTEHLFVAHFAPNVNVVKVVATDRFGEKFEIESKG
ncbi:calcineurin-like phosphoesterase family protein [Pedobacter sandarakinus]|uniref:calcineurin-like phosphoesterase family protein n=1 Tax=Pedobacter sandarakinus TaxID=353156 RepID=UPI002245A191|nr:calcineurin-like phosphoesterase family protein [Pedobacter sandarakinus]MCX2574506.1 calcineurin-like phosphoesterase family protein [Pedobacter sandarakinus]